MDQEERPARQTEERGGVRRRKLEARPGSVRGRGRMGLDIGERRVEPRGQERRDEEEGGKEWGGGGVRQELQEGMNLENHLPKFQIFFQTFSI